VAEIVGEQSPSHVVYFSEIKGAVERLKGRNNCVLCVNCGL
jgi:hypothetical protein